MTNAFIDKLNGFACLTPADAALLQAACEPARDVPPRTDLIREGDKPGPVFVILDGWACRYKLLPDGSRQITAFMMPGDFCDMHVSLLDEMDHSLATITACRVATIGRAQIEVLTKSATITRAFWWAQLVDEGILRAWIVSMGRRSSLERVTHLMCELYVRARSVGRTIDEQVRLPLTQIILGDALGLTPVHVNRVLRRLKADGIMELSGGTLTISDPAKLAIVAGFDDNYLHRRTRGAGRPAPQASGNVAVSPAGST